MKLFTCLSAIALLLTINQSKAQADETGMLCKGSNSNFSYLWVSVGGTDYNHPDQTVKVAYQRAGGQQILNGGYYNVLSQTSSEQISIMAKEGNPLFQLDVSKTGESQGDELLSGTLKISFNGLDNTVYEFPISCTK